MIARRPPIPVDSSTTIFNYLVAPRELKTIPVNRSTDRDKSAVLARFGIYCEGFGMLSSEELAWLALLTLPQTLRLN